MSWFTVSQSTAAPDKRQIDQNLVGRQLRCPQKYVIFYRFRRKTYHSFKLPQKFEYKYQATTQINRMNLSEFFFLLLFFVAVSLTWYLGDNRSFYDLAHLTPIIINKQVLFLFWLFFCFAKYFSLIFTWLFYVLLDLKTCSKLNKIASIPIGDEMSTERYEQCTTMKLFALSSFLVGQKQKTKNFHGNKRRKKDNEWLEVW